MAVALASPSPRGSARQRNEDVRANALQRHQAQVLAAHTPRVAKDVQGAFLALLKSAVHDPQGSLPPLPFEEKAKQVAYAGVSYSQPDYDAFSKTMGKILQKEWLAIGGISLKGVNASLGITIDFELNERILPKGIIARQVTKVTQSTQVAIGKTIKQGIADGVHPSVIAKRMRDQLTGYAGLEDLSKSRAYTIARTETANAYNVGTIIGYEQSGLVSLARCIDAPSCGWRGHNDGIKANGLVKPLDVAKANPISHPNCVRAWAAVVSKQTGPLNAPGVQPKATGPVGSQLADYSNPKNWLDSRGPFDGTTPLEKWGHELFLQAGNVPRNMLDAMSSYGGGGYRAINGVLRQARELLNYLTSGSYAVIDEEIAALEQFINRMRTPDAVETFRGMGSGRSLGFNRRWSDAEFRAHANSLVGTTHVDEGFYSAALSKTSAFGGKVRLQMTVPKGYHAAPVSIEAKGQAYGSAVSNGAMYESELLLQRGARYRVDRVEFTGSPPYTEVILHGHILPGGPLVPIKPGVTQAAHNAVMSAQP